MKIEDNTLFIDEEIIDEMVEEFFATLKQDEIKKVIINNPNLGASIIQLLLYFSKEKEIETNDKTLQKIFENVKVLQ
jgi:molecular chaperone DnaK (HSP70)